MRKNNYVVSCSLAVILTVVSGAAFGAIRAGNTGGSYAGSYKNTMALQQQYNDYIAATEAEAAATEQETELPIHVADQDLAERIKNGDQDAGVTFTKLDACNMIYPGGEFVWDKPTLGSRIGGGPTCVAVVEMRVLGQGSTATTEYITVARGKLAAGDMLKCNVSNFPRSSYLPEIENVMLPADKAPTRQDVIKAMNQEQKSKAGLKIAAGLLVGGLGGNMTGKNDAGKDGLFGTSKNKLKNTAIGATAGAALMAASTFSGKVAGDVIMGAGINAAAGGMVGNMSGTGDNVLRIEKCEGPSGETTCLWGKIQQKGALPDADKEKTFFYGYSDKTLIICEEKDDDGYFKSCKTSSGFIPKKVCGFSFSDFERKNPTDRTTECLKTGKLYSKSQDSDFKMENSESGGYVKLDTDDVEKISGAAVNAVILNFPENRFGSKTDDWYKWIAENSATATVCKRDGKGKPYDCDDQELRKSVGDSFGNFKVTQLDASDGELIDFSNKARLGATAKGAGIGGAVGGFSGYQGAQNDIDERLTLSTREYNDSLEKVYCGTGQKFLSFYNDEVEIPMLIEQ